MNVTGVTTDGVFKKKVNCLSDRGVFGDVGIGNNLLFAGVFALDVNNLI